MVLWWNPTCLTGTQLGWVLSLARSLTSIKRRIKSIKTNQPREEVDEMELQTRVFGRDRAKKLEVKIDRLHGERQEDSIYAEVCDV